MCPGFILTSMRDAEYSEEMKAAYGANVPLGRLGRPEEAAAMFAFLVSDDEAYTTGHCWLVDGGEVAGGLTSQA